MSGGMVLVDVSGKASSVMSVKGQMVDFDTQRQALDIGSEDQVLTVSAGGLPNWEDAAAGGATITTQEISPTTDQTTTSGSTAVTNGSITLANRTDGVVLATYFQGANSTVADQIVCQLYYNGALQKSVNSRLATTGQSQLITISTTDDLDGGSMVCYWGTGGGTATLFNAPTNMSRCVLFEVS